MATFDFSIKPVEALRNDLDRLTVLRFLMDTRPVAQLVNLMNELLSDDAMPFDIQWAYHDFAAAVLSCEPSQVTGDRWRDCLIGEILERENSFSLGAWKGRADDALLRAFARDLAIVQALFLLDDAMVRNWCMPSQSGADLSNWAEFSNMGFYIVDGDGPLPMMRRMLLSSEDWSQLAKPLMDIHAQFGAGAVVGHRYVEFNGEDFSPVRRINSMVGEPDPALLDALSRHAAGEASGAVFISGPDAMRVALRSLEASGARAIRLRDISAFPALCRRLAGTDTRFAVVLPAPHPADPLLNDLLGEGFAALDENLLPVALSPSGDPMLTARFPISI